MAKRVGFIGCGNMGSALIKGLLTKRVVEPSNIYTCDMDEAKLAGLAEETGVNISKTLGEVSVNSDLLFLAVKPQSFEQVLDEISDIEDVLLVSIAAGIKTGQIEKMVPKARVVRVMPNTPAMVYEMASAYCLGKSAKPEDGELVQELLSSIGVCVKVPEDLMDAVTGLSGSGPAYIYLIIKALSEAGMEQGLSPEVSIQLATQTVKGAAEMVAQTGKSPKELIDQVTSPGGTTIEGLKVLEENNVADSLKKAVQADTQQSKKLSE